MFENPLIQFLEISNGCDAYQLKNSLWNSFSINLNSFSC